MLRTCPGVYGHLHLWVPKLQGHRNTYICTYVGDICIPPTKLKHTSYVSRYVSRILRNECIIEKY